jgi:hypothetical protein
MCHAKKCYLGLLPNLQETTMTEIKLTSDEVFILKAILSKLAIKGRTGEIGIVHGMDRFVSSQLILKKPERELLTSIAKKLGLELIVEIR